ncbi:hypothetical protein, variant [Cryptococcus amylolentus CBS 6039]|uniref:Uncharacterized protein n=1 Tax=Cryptococcus amylolentus CBS 6039 TaxID=1295533 RepID=A0A1E3I6S4_9TREE|nr:hypothetical protein, variant [Cryptococcus amylolentus CBS 6039]ODN83536.1 hypothetical protein, variant [Cryptococcus amylolentus CBS 6039]
MQLVLTNVDHRTVKMLTSRTRMCCVTRELRPVAHLIRLTPIYFPSTGDRPHSLQLLPDGVAESSTASKGKSLYVTCHRDYIKRLYEPKGPHLPFIRGISSLQLPPNLVDIIHAQLLSRVLWELRYILRRIRHLPKGHLESQKKTQRVLVRWPNPKGQMDSANGVVALLDLAGLTPAPVDSPFDLKEIPFPASLPQNVPSPLMTPLSEHQDVPTYHLASLFPPSLHAYLHKSLWSIFHVERPRGVPNTSSSDTKGKEQSEHELLAMSTLEASSNGSALGTDVAIALWRLVCFHGYGWEQT